MIKMAFFDAKPYEIEAFKKWNSDGEIDIRYMEHKLNAQTVDSAKGCDVVCAFVNDTIDAKVLDELKKLGVKMGHALRRLQQPGSEGLGRPEGRPRTGLLPPCGSRACHGPLADPEPQDP